MSTIERIAIERFSWRNMLDPSIQPVT
jgi:hypothetical protein